MTPVLFRLGIEIQEGQKDGVEDKNEYYYDIDDVQFMEKYQQLAPSFEYIEQYEIEYYTREQQQNLKPKFAPGLNDHIKPALHNTNL
jgi:hypothetical protein